MPTPRLLSCAALAAALLTGGVAPAQPAPEPSPLPPPPPAAAEPAPPAPAVETEFDSLAPACHRKSADCPPPACAANPRVIVVKVPAPEVIYRSACPAPAGEAHAGKTCGLAGRFLRGRTCAAPAGAPAPAPAGTATVYQTYTVPYLTYNWVPAVQQPAGFAPTGFAPAGFAPVGVMPAGGPAPCGTQPAGGPITAELETLLIRALVNRFLRPGETPAPAPAADACDARVKALQAQIAELDRRIAAVQQDTREATLLNTRAIVDLQKEVNQLFDAVNQLNPADGKEKIVGDLQSAVKKIQAGRK